MSDLCVDVGYGIVAVVVYFLYRNYPKAIWMQFEFDENKSRVNRAKHGIDFVEAQALWCDDLRYRDSCSHRGRATLDGHWHDWGNALVGNCDLSP